MESQRLMSLELENIELKTINSEITKDLLKFQEENEIIQKKIKQQQNEIEILEKEKKKIQEDMKYFQNERSNKRHSFSIFLPKKTTDKTKSRNSEEFSKNILENLGQTEEKNNLNHNNRTIFKSISGTKFFFFLYNQI